MKKVFMSMAIVAAMFAAAACSCGNNSQKAEACEACEACDSTCTEVCDTTKCCCDSTATVDTTVVAE